MASKLITPVFRGAFVSLFKATAMKGQPDAKKKFQIRAVFDADADLSALKNAAAEAVAEKWGDKPPKMLRSPFRANDELENPIAGAADDAIVITFSANEDRRPGVVDADLNDILDEAECYSGAYYRAQVRAYAYEAAGNKGVAFGLDNVQKIKDGEPMGGRIPASKAFESFGDGGSKKGAAALFE